MNETETETERGPADLPCCSPSSQGEGPPGLRSQPLVARQVDGLIWKPDGGPRVPDPQSWCPSTWCVDGHWGYAEGGVKYVLAGRGGPEASASAYAESNTVTNRSNQGSPSASANSRQSAPPLSQCLRAISP